MEIKDKLIDSLSKATLDYGKVEVQLEHPENLEHGDYSTNVAMILAKKSGKNPMDLAREIKERMENGKWKMENINRVEATAPGFINFWLSQDYLSKELELALKEGNRYPSVALRASGNRGKTVVVEYSSPNIAKRFGIGHLRSTIIGQSIYNIYQLLGYNVIGDNHLGDWGTQFGTLIYQIITQKLDAGKLEIDDLEQLYVDFNEHAQEDKNIWEEARLWFKKLEDGDEQAKKIWKACVKISLGEFDRIYKLLGVSFDNMHGESFYEDKMAPIIAELKEKKLAVEDQGALIIKYPDDEFPPGIVLKSDGATTYLTRDLAQVKFRLSQWNPDLLIYEVGVEQTLHFRQLFRAIELLGWAKQDRFVHVKHGLYLNPEGKKFSTRRGDTVGIEGVLTEAVERAKKLGSEANDEVAQAVGIGAVKYFDLSHSPESNIVFSWEKMFLLTGNSGPYLQYTYARALSVLRKSGLLGVGNWSSGDQSVGSKSYEGSKTNTQKPANQKPKTEKLNSEEDSLLRTLYKFPEVVESAAENYAPNLICNYLFDLASKYNLMYNNLPILGNALRLELTQATANILKTGLELLGINAPEKM